MTSASTSDRAKRSASSERAVRASRRSDAPSPGCSPSTRARWRLTARMTRLSARPCGTAPKVQMVFQDPYASLDPRFPVGRTVAEPIVIHGAGRSKRKPGQGRSLLERVGLSADMGARYPHEFPAVNDSDGNRAGAGRRTAIIVADEADLCPRRVDPGSGAGPAVGTATELGIGCCSSPTTWLSSGISSRVAVMRAGRILEFGPTQTVLEDPPTSIPNAFSAVPIPTLHNATARDRTIPGRLSAGPLVDVAPVIGPPHDHRYRRLRTRCRPRCLPCPGRRRSCRPGAIRGSSATWR